MSKLTIKLSYEDIPTYTRPGIGVYNEETYVGNWYEETVRNTLKREDFIRRRECGELTIQKTQNMVDLLLKPIEFSPPEMDAYLRYGDKLQIISPGPSCKLAKEVYPFKRNYCKIAHLCLSASVPPTSIDHAPYLSTDSIISASPLLFPVVRNCFIIEHPDCPTAHIGKVVEYGDVFRIRAFDTQYFKLYLFSAPAIRVHSLATHSAKPKVRFSDIPLQETLWTTFPMDADSKLRMDLGVPVPLRTPLLIRHNLSGQNLSYESLFSVLTYFGCEMEVTLDTKLDKIKRPTFENMWYFDNIRGLPKEKDPCTKDFEKQAEFSAKINVNMANRSAVESSKEEEGNREEQDYNQQEDDEDDCDAGDGQERESRQGEGQTNGQGEGRNNGMDEIRRGQTNDQGAIPRAEDVIQDAEKMMAQMSLAKSKNGLRNYDPATGPQPNAWSYTLQENPRYPNFPNQKWDCGNTNCCYSPVAVKKAEEIEGVDCTKRPCCEPGPRPASLNTVAGSSLCNKLIF